MSEDKGIWLPKWLIKLDMSWTKKLLIAEISQLEILEEGCFANNKHFAEKLNISKQAVSNALNDLAKEGWIIIDNSKTVRNFGRTITIHNDVYPIHNDVQGIHDGVHPIHNRVQSKGNNTINNTINNNKEIKEFKNSSEENQQGGSTVSSSLAVNEPAAQSELIAEFENFRKSYKGTKRGLEVEFKDFKKHKDFSRCVSLLLPALQKEEQQRQLAENAGKFFPARKNLKTWLNQRCWETEHETIKEPTEQELIAEFNQIGFIEFKRKYGNQKAVDIDFIAS